MAQSTSCPGCHKPVIVADEKLAAGKRRGPIRELRTCGKVTVGKRARLICEHIIAHGGIECLGIIDAKEVVAGEGLYLGPKSSFKGALHAPTVVMESGAAVKPSMFHVPSDPQGLLEEREAPKPKTPAPPEKAPKKKSTQTPGKTDPSAKTLRGASAGSIPLGATKKK